MSLVLTCCSNSSKVLQPTPMWSPVADQVKLEELDLHRLFKDEVEQGGRFVITCVNELILQQTLPRPAFVNGPWNAEPCRCAIGASLSQVFYLTTSNQPHTVVHLYCEALPSCRMIFCQPVVCQLFTQPGIWCTQNENTTCWVEVGDLSALNYLRVQRTPTPFERIQM